MNLERHIARLDGYEGELARSHAKLALERAAGRTALAEEVDFLTDFRAAAHRRDVAPWGHRALAAALAAAGLALAATGAAALAHRPGPLSLALAGAALAAAGTALACARTRRRRDRIERAWFVAAMVALQEGTSIFDLRWEALDPCPGAKDGDRAA